MPSIPISFHSEDIKFVLSSKKSIKHWVQQVVLSEKLKLGPISYIFCNDRYLHEVNVKYLNHDTYTDIITFDYSEDKTVSGDLFISYERVKENARVFKTSINDELHRVMIHGVLHLCGYGDKSDKEKMIMRQKEENCLQLIF
ncbi:MAG: putative rRNA maturation factor [Glaciecola sp.]|jgi:probable rRNA maturation factor